MSRKRIFSCDRCIQLFSGRVAFDYHMNAHRRTDPPKRRESTPKLRIIWEPSSNYMPMGYPPVCYDDESGNESATPKENPT